MFPRVIPMALACILGGQQALAQGQTGASALTEQDFLAEMPVVLSVSRLAQRLDEVPGAMTILDREFIRMTGARDVVDLLRFVPGFVTSTTFETDAPMAYYHGKVDDWANRLQLLVDGRSVYSSFLQGSVGLGFQSTALDDIERIEILRGSNSAAYGSRAFLGVVNIVTRSPGDFGAGSARVTAGENGVADLYGNVAWRGEQSSSRISVDTRGDAGLRKTGSVAGAKGDNRVSRVNFASELDISSALGMTIRAGLVDLAAYRGDGKSPGNFERLRFMDAAYAQATVRYVVSADEEVEAQLSRTAFEHHDHFPYFNSGAPANYQGVKIDWSGSENNDVLGLQYTRRYNPTLRYVAGVEVRQEELRAESSFYQRSAISSQARRMFGNLEWRPVQDWVVNLGAHYEYVPSEVSAVSPRLMANWHWMPGHTLRFGVSTAFRQPSPFEKYQDRRYFDASGAFLLQTGAPNTNLRSEKVLSRELGYFIGAHDLPVQADVRLFHEYISDGLSHDLATPDVYWNSENYDMRGGELQVSWQPRSSTRLSLAWTRTDITINNSISNDAAFRTEYSTPKTSGSAMLTQTFGVWDCSLMYTDANDVALMSSSSNHVRSSFYRTDLRVARHLRWRGAKGEMALTVQNLNDPYQDGDWKFQFDRRALFSLRFEY
ncbi:TonB-dependent receptor [Curvibacter sp. APW13]|uniref:TonB-dependent receptor plug domain-containing protein n=1 Tax=Curvibacter sp. APW13 TaxID=3077236 RepID=UPI0028DD55F1|nr:TonB-dependent receptor [Curvibacter sp. APW13]MDT8992232.1 TonB-dependent receptor [Curvibacter sp. APW13]